MPCCYTEGKRPVENKIGNDIRERERELMVCGPGQGMGFDLTL